MRGPIRHLLLGSVLVASSWSGAASAAEPPVPDGIDVLNTPLEQLAEIPVVSVSRRAESLQDAAAAVFVLTREEIIRSGARKIPDALRLVPGVEVSRVDASTWAVSVRGFHTAASNKLLVLIDGRSIYDPLFSGVFWETVDIPIALIDRIEVVRGPGGTQWGANAVNGVINIITRRATDAPPLAVVTGGGDFERAFATVVGSGEVGGVPLLGYAKHTERGPSAGPGRPQDIVRHDLAGVRGDIERDADRFMFKLETFQVTAGDAATPSAAQRNGHRGTNLTAQWHSRPEDGVERWIQTYLDHFDLDNPAVGEERLTFDVEFRQTHASGADGPFSWGFGYRIAADELDNATLFPRDQRTDRIYSAFVEQVWSVGERGRLTLGSKAEHNDYSGVEWQPSARYAHKHDGEATTWSAVSRAVRVPSRLEADLVTFGNPDLRAETLLGFEVGHRRPVGALAWFSATAFVNDYDRLATVDATPQISNGQHGRTLGAETALRWQPSETLRGDFAYSYLDLDLTLEPGHVAALFAPGDFAGISARHRLNLRLAWQASSALEIDGSLRHVSETPDGNIEAYTVVDLRLAWRLSERLELALVGRDLLRAAHYEASDAGSTLVRPSGYLMLHWSH